MGGVSIASIPGDMRVAIVDERNAVTRGEGIGQVSTLNQNDSYTRDFRPSESHQSLSGDSRIPDRGDAATESKMRSTLTC